jgi:hypothetical protein
MRRYPTMLAAALLICAYGPTPKIVVLTSEIRGWEYGNEPL